MSDYNDSIHQTDNTGMRMIRRMVSIATLLTIWGCSFGLTFSAKFEGLKQGMKPDEVMEKLGTSNRLIDSMEVRGVTVRTDRYIVETERWPGTTPRWDEKNMGVTRTMYRYEERYLAFIGDSLFTWGTIDDYLVDKDVFIVDLGKAIKSK